MAVPLFIFTVTACCFIKDCRRTDPDKQLREILKYQARSQVLKLDATYRPVLDQFLAGLDNLEREEALENFQELVGSIIILASPLSTACLSYLLRISKADVDCRLDLLYLVLSIPSNPESSIKLLYLSFRDFLVSPKMHNTNPF